MNQSPAVIRFLAIFCLALASGSLWAVTPATPDKPAKSKSKVDLSQTHFREIPYAELENRIDSKIVVHTINNTVRSGTLTRFTNATIQLKLGPEAASIELSIPNTAVRKIMLELGPPDPLFVAETTDKKGESGAKKN